MGVGGLDEIGLGDRLIDRFGLVSLLLASAALAVGDYVTAFEAPFSTGFTIAETALVVPWAFLVFRLDARDPVRRKPRRWGRARWVAVHVANGLLLVGCLAEKWAILLADGGLTGGDALAQYRILTVAAYVFVNVGLLGRGSRVARLILSLSDRPARLSALSFGLAGLLGALLLNLPQSLRNPADASFVDGLFTAISAVCVTGLVVHPTPDTYTPFGQAVLLVLMQAGGLGIMSLYAGFTVLAGRRLRLRSSATLAEIIDAESLASLRRTLLGIVAYTFVIEAVGAVILYLLFLGYPATAAGLGAEGLAAGAGNRVWAAVFHAVSAFCNAGFTLFRGNAEAFAGDWAVSLTLMALIVLGGLGFPVLRELRRQLVVRVRRRPATRISLHTRVVLVTSGTLVAAAALALLALEHDGSMAGLPWDERVLTALFQSVTARTAGFNTLPIGAMAAPALMLLCLVMFVGAAPGSTGGGIKTTTVAVLFATFRAELGGRPHVRLLDRTVARATVQRAMGVAFLSVILVSLILLALLVTERHAPLDLAFETFSAFATVGLSTGVTPTLSTTGKLLITLTMLVGRIGPLTMALAFAARVQRQAFRYPEERVTIG
ncbi:MAG: TrkH family potassium uptake protein [Myxococcota bacterium]